MVFVVLLIAPLLVYRHTTMPSSLEITVKLSLYRTDDDSHGTIEAFSLKMTEMPNRLFDNVTLIRPYGLDNISIASWTLEIVMNDSVRAPLTWHHEIIPSENVAGDYAGALIHSMRVSGKFRLWIILHGESNGIEEVTDSMSELISVS